MKLLEHHLNITVVDNPFLTTNHKEITISKSQLLQRYPVDLYQYIVNGKVDRIKLKNNDNIIVVPRVTGGGRELNQTLALLALTAAAVYTGGAAAGALGLAQGSIAYSVTSTVVASVVMGVGAKYIKFGTDPDVLTPEERFRLTGVAANRSRYGEVIPLTVGKIRVAPDLVSQTYVEYAGDDQYLYQIYCFGLIPQGGINVTDIKVGNQPIDSYDEIEYQLSGNDGKIDLFPACVDTAQGGILNDANDFIIATTAENTTRISIDIEFVLFAINKKGKYYDQQIEFKIEYKKVSDTDWSIFSNGSFSKYILMERVITGESYNALTGEVQYEYAEVPAINPNGNITFENGDAKPFIESFSKNVPADQYQVRITRISGKSDDNKRSMNLNVLQVRSFQPDTGIYTNQKRLAIKAKASAQLRGALGQVSAIVETATVAGLYSRNPGLIFKSFAMEHGGFTQDQLDTASIDDFKAYCDSQQFEFNYTFNKPTTVGECLELIAAAGNAQISWATGKLGVVIDKENQPVIQAFTEENIIRDSMTVTYLTDQAQAGISVSYLDRDNDYILAQAKVGNAPFTHVEVAGITNRAQAHKIANLLYNKQKHTREIISFETNFLGCVVNKGDVISVTNSHVLDSPRICKIISLEQTQDDKIIITARKEDSSYYQLETDNQPQTKGYSIFGWENGIGETNTPNIVNGIPDVGPSYWDRRSLIAKNINIKAKTSVVDQKIYVFLNWENIQCTGSRIIIKPSTGTTRTFDAYGSSASIEVSRDINYIDFEFNPTGITFNPLHPSQQVKAETISFKYYVDPNKISFEKYEAGVPNVAGLQLDEGWDNPHAAEFVGRDCSIKWRLPTSNGISLRNDVTGLDAGDSPNDWLRYYEIDVFNVDDTSNPIKLTTLTTNKTNITFTHHQNVRFSKKAGLAPSRNLKFMVGVVAVWGQRSAKKVPLYVTNPKPAPLQNVVGTGMYKSIGITYDTTVTNDNDFEGIVVWMTGSDPAPDGTEVGSGNCVYKGKDTHIWINNLTPGNTYKFWIGAYDAFGFEQPSGVNYVGPFNVTVPTVSQEIGQGAIDAFNLSNTELITSSSQIANDVVVSNHISTNAIGTTHLQSDSVTNDQIANNAVDGVNIRTDAIGTVHITQNAVGTAQLQTNSVTNDQIATDAVNSDSIADNSVATVHILTDAITNDLISPNAVGTNELQTNSVTNDQIATDAVNGDSIASNAVGSTQLAANAVDGSHVKQDALTGYHLNQNGVLVETATGLAANIVDQTHLQSNSVGTSQLQSNAVTNDQIATDAVNQDSIADNSVYQYQLINEAATRVKTHEILTYQGIHEAPLTTDGFVLLFDFQIYQSTLAGKRVHLFYTFEFWKNTGYNYTMPVEIAVKRSWEERTYPSWWDWNVNDPHPEDPDWLYHNYTGNLALDTPPEIQQYDSTKQLVEQTLFPFSYISGYTVAGVTDRQYVSLAFSFDYPTIYDRYAGNIKTELLIRPNPANPANDPNAEVVGILNLYFKEMLLKR